MAITLSSTLKDLMLNEMIDVFTFGTTNLTFQCVTTTGTVADSFTVADTYFFTDTDDKMKFNISAYGGNLVFTIPPSTSDVQYIRLKGTLETNGVQILSEWALDATPTDERLDYPNGGSLSLSQWVMAITAE